MMHATKQTLYWAIDPTATDEYARELFVKRYGKQPAEVKRYPKSVLLLGPVNDGK